MEESAICLLFNRYTDQVLILFPTRICVVFFLSFFKTFICG